MSAPKISEAILELKKDWRVWRRFLAETRNRGYVTSAVNLLVAGSGDAIISGSLTAFDIGDAEARAWLGYFRGIGAIAPSGESNKGC